MEDIGHFFSLSCPTRGLTRLIKNQTKQDDFRKEIKLQKSIFFIVKIVLTFYRPLKLSFKNHTNGLKGQLQGHTAIFKGLKMTFRAKIMEKNIPR